MSGQQGGVPVGSEAESLGCLPAPPFPLLFSSPKKTWGKRDEARLRRAKAMDSISIPTNLSTWRRLLPASMYGYGCFFPLSRRTTGSKKQSQEEKWGMLLVPKCADFVHVGSGSCIVDVINHVIS